MFEALKPLPEDKILALMQKFREDPRETKIDLGVGVYKNASGVTPVMRAVKAAEKRIWEEETTKSYTGPCLHLAPPEGPCASRQLLQNLIVTSRLLIL